MSSSPSPVITRTRRCGCASARPSADHRGSTHRAPQRKVSGRSPAAVTSQAVLPRPATTSGASGSASSASASSRRRKRKAFAGARAIAVTARTTWRRSGADRSAQLPGPALERHHARGVHRFAGASPPCPAAARSARELQHGSRALAHRQLPGICSPHSPRMVTSASSGKRPTWLSASMLTQLPTPLLCIRSAARWPPSQAPAASATPSSSVVSTMARSAGSA